MPNSADEPAQPGTNSATNGAARKRETRAWPLTWCLVAFGLVIALPALLFSAFLIGRFSDLLRHQREGDIFEINRALAGSIDNEISGLRTTVQVLSGSPLLDTKDFASFHARATATLADTESYILLLDHTFQQLLNTRVPYGAPLGKTSALEAAKMATETKKPYVSGIFFGKVAKKHVFDIIYPVLRNGDVRYLLVLTRNVETLSPLLERQRLQPEWRIMLSDQNNKILAASPEQAGLIGKPLPRDVANVTGGVEGLRTLTVSGERALMVYRKSGVTDWQVTTIVPVSAFEAPLRQSRLFLIVGGAAFLAISLVIAFLFGRSMTRPMRALSAAAAAVGRGETVEPLSSPLQEVNNVSEALAAAARQRNKSEQHNKLLMRELAHRAKNQLAVIQAMVGRTAEASNTIQEFEASLRDRLHGLASSIDVVERQSWQGALLDDLVRAHLEPFIDQDSDRMTLDGPAILLRSDAAQMIGLVLHELATNAAKYGALSSKDGMLHIRWKLDGAEENKRFHMQWQESGGPAVRKPKRRGFGSVVIDRLVARSLNGTVKLDYAKPGLAWELECPADGFLL